jgi:PAS domain S-box-containing protein
MSSWSRSMNDATVTLKSSTMSQETRALGLLKKYPVQIAIVFVAYVVAGKLGQATTNIRSSNLGPVWPAYGIAVAAILIWGYRVWLGVAAGAFLVAFFSPVPHIAALGQAAGATLAATAAAFLVHYVADFRPSLSRLSDVLSLIAFGGFGSAVVSASIGVSILYATHVHAYSALGRAWLIYWLGDATGVLLVTPLVLTFADFRKVRDWRRVAELGVLLLLLTVTCFTVFSDLPLIPVRLHFMAFAVVPFVIWAAINFGMSGATLSVLIVAAVATVATAYGSGPFAQHTPFTNAVLLDVFFVMLSVSGMALAAVVSEREHLLRQQAVMEARLRLAAIVESSDDAIVCVDADGIITDWNKGAEQLYGYTETEAIGLPLATLIPSNLLDEENKILQKLKAGERIEHYETTRVTKSGKSVDVSLTISPLKDSIGRVVGISKIARDITERKRVAEAVRESEERLHLAAQAGRMYAYEWDLTTDMVLRSSEYLNVLGLRSEPVQLTRQQLLETVHPDDRAKFISAVADVRPENPNVQLTYRALRSDGSVIWLEKHGRAFFDDNGKMVRMIGIVADVTERKLADDALRASEERLRLAQQAARIGSFERDIRTGVVSWTAQMESLYGLPPGGFGGTQDSFMDLIYPDDRARIMELAEEALETGRPTEGEWRVVWPDMSIRWIAGRWQVFRNESGEPSRVVGVNIDVTERKEAEEALASMSRKLIEAQEQERARIGRELHDDINQRLAMLALELGQLKDNPSETQNRVEELRNRTTEISDDVQALSHELHSSKLEYLGVVAGIKSWCKEFGERQRMEVDFSSDVPTPIPLEIGISLFRVVQEAVHNAVKHSGVKHFDVQLWASSGEIHLTVSDFGVGFDSDTAMKGSGLGLASMRERMRLSGGELSITSQPKRGTTIHARVPFKPSSDFAEAAG